MGVGGWPPCASLAHSNHSHSLRHKLPLLRNLHHQTRSLCLNVLRPKGISPHSLRTWGHASSSLSWPLPHHSLCSFHWLHYRGSWSKVQDSQFLRASPTILLSSTFSPDPKFIANNCKPSISGITHYKPPTCLPSSPLWPLNSNNHSIPLGPPSIDPPRSHCPTHLLSGPSLLL